MRFILRIISVLLIVAISDFLIGNLLRHFYFKQVSGQNYRNTFILDSTNAQVLVFGSSRANFHYVPEIFEDSLRMSFYNAGSDGQFLFFNSALLKSILKRYTPKIVILDITPTELFYDKKSYDRLSSLLPYYRNHTEIRKIIEYKSYFEKFKLISSIYPFNSEILGIIKGNLKKNNQGKQDQNGFLPLKNNIRDTSLKFMEVPKSKIDTLKVNALTSFVYYCSERNINLIFIVSPIYAHTISSIENDIITQAANKNDIDFWNFTKDTCFLSEPTYFQDYLHLNELGAKKFSSIVANKIIQKQLIDSFQKAKGNIFGDTQPLKSVYH